MLSLLIIVGLMLNIVGGLMISAALWNGWLHVRAMHKDVY